MEMTLTPEMERTIQHEIEIGRFATPVEVVAAALDRMREEDSPLAGWDKDELNAVIEEGIWSAKNEPLVSPAEARAHLARVRAELTRG